MTVSVLPPLRLASLRTALSQRNARPRDALVQMPILLECSAEVIDVLAEQAEFVRLGSSTTVFGRDSVPTGLFFVCRGAVRLMIRGAEDRDRVAELFEPGSLFGEIGVFTGARYRTWTKTVGASVLIHVPVKSVHAALALDNPLSQRMLVAVCTRTQRLIEALGFRAGGSASSRVATYLLELRERSAEEEQDSVLLPAPKKTIASLLNLTPETLSRVLRNLVASEMIKVQGKRIDILQPQQLRSLLSGEQSNES